MTIAITMNITTRISIFLTLNQDDTDGFNGLNGSKLLGFRYTMGTNQSSHTSICIIRSTFLW